jgi:hypothetical protein
MSQRHGASSGCGWRRQLVAANVLNKHSQKDGQAVVFQLWGWGGGLTTPPQLVAKCYTGPWNGFIWLRIGTSGGLLWIVGFHKSRIFLTFWATISFSRRTTPRSQSVSQSASQPASLSVSQSVIQSVSELVSSRKIKLWYVFCSWSYKCEIHLIVRIWFLAFSYSNCPEIWRQKWIRAPDFP